MESLPALKMFKYKLNEGVLQDLLEGTVRDEYKKGVSDPTRLVARYEKTTNKRLKAERIEVKKEMIKANQVIEQLGLF
jgi:ribosomal protein L33